MGAKLGIYVPLTPAAGYINMYGADCTVDADCNNDTKVGAL